MFWYSKEIVHTEHEQTPAAVQNDRTFPQSFHTTAYVHFAFTKDNIPMVDPNLLPGVLTFKLIGKILGDPSS